MARFMKKWWLETQTTVDGDVKVFKGWLTYSP